MTIRDLRNFLDGLVIDGVDWDKEVFVEVLEEGVYHSRTSMASLSLDNDGNLVLSEEGI